MYYFPGHKTGFFHIPKTGGTAMSRFLLSAFAERGDAGQEIAKNRWHETLAEKENVLGQNLAAESTFITTVRNPYAMVVSLYFWCRLKVERQDFDLKDYPETEQIAAMNFAEYMDWYMENEQPTENWFLKNGCIPENLHILRIEHIEKEADELLNKKMALGFTVKVPVANASRHAPYMSYLNDDFIRQINKKHAWTFEHFYPELVKSR